jgi:uncharacterized coiled-coil DUF342 family protein
VTRQDERNAIRKELMALDATRERLREQAGAMKSKLRFFSVDAVEKEIVRLEDAIAHTTVSLNEEKKMVAQIKDLGKSKELVRAYAEAQGKISGDDGSRKAVIDRLKAKDGEIDAVKAEQTSLRGELTATKKKEDKAVSDVPKLNDERNALYETIKANREKIRALRDAHKKKEDAYYERERLWRAYLKVEKQKQWEAGLEERKAREAAKKQWELENAPEPFEAEVTAAEQLIAYLAKWDTGASEEKKAEEAARRAAAEKAEAAFAGMSLVTKKAPDENVFGLSSGVGARGKKGKKFGKKPSVAAELSKDTLAPAQKNERLQIPFDAYGGFAKLSVTVPTMTADVPKTVAALRLKKAEFLEKRRVKKERAAAGLEDEDEKREKEALKAERKGKEREKKDKGRGGRRGAVSVTLTIVDEAVTCVISVAEKVEKAEK